jgi:hypothetical protein
VSRHEPPSPVLLLAEMLYFNIIALPENKNDISQNGICVEVFMHDFLQLHH